MQQASPSQHAHAKSDGSLAASSVEICRLRASPNLPCAAPVLGMPSGPVASSGWTWPKRARNSSRLGASGANSSGQAASANVTPLPPIPDEYARNSQNQLPNMEAHATDKHSQRTPSSIGQFPPNFQATGAPHLSKHASSAPTDPRETSWAARGQPKNIGQSESPRTGAQARFRRWTGCLERERMPVSAFRSRRGGSGTRMSASAPRSASERSPGPERPCSGNSLLDRTPGRSRTSPSKAGFVRKAYPRVALKDCALGNVCAFALL